MCLLVRDVEERYSKWFCNVPRFMMLQEHFLYSGIRVI
jgi:hypothetical protein